MVARLLSANVGPPREIAWRGQTVRTAIWKNPVEGKRMVRQLNIDGDAQGDLAAHGGEHRAVFVYHLIPIATGKINFIVQASPLDNSERTSRLTVRLIQRCASATATGLAVRCSRSPSHASLAFASAYEWTNRGWPRY